MRPVLKAPGTILIKLRYNGLLSKFAFNFNLRRYNMALGCACGSEVGRCKC
jgi:hypothetical protein